MTISSTVSNCWGGSGSSLSILHGSVFLLSSPRSVAQERETEMALCFRSQQGSALEGIVIATVTTLFAALWHHLVCPVRQVIGRPPETLIASSMNHGLGAVT